MNIQTVKFNEFSFLDVHNPLELEIKHLKKEFDFSDLHLEDYLHRKQIPQVDTYKDYVLVVLDFPLLGSLDQEASNGLIDQLTKILPTPPTTTASTPQPPINGKTPTKKITTKTKLKTGHVNFFIGKDYLVVLHDEKTPQIDEIFALCQKTLHHRQEYLGEGPMYLFYRIIKVLVDHAFTAANDISEAIDYIDKQVIDNDIPKIVEDISVTRRNLVVFHTMIKQAIPVMTELESGKKVPLEAKMTYLWVNIRDHLKEISARIEDNKELLEGISVSHESVLTFRTNEIVKFLTIITSMSFPFIIVNNLYSMNVKGLPYADQPWIVWVLFEVIAAGSVGILFYFKAKKWL